MLEHKGRYNARALGHAFGQASTGNYQIGVELEVVDGEAAGERITWYGTFSEKSAEHTVKGLRALGWTGDNLATLEAAGFGTKTASIVIEHEQDRDGAWRAKVAWVNPAGGVAFKNKVEGAELVAFAASMKGTILALGGVERQAQPNRAQPSETHRRTGGLAPRRDFGPSQEELAGVLPPPDGDIPW